MRCTQYIGLSHNADSYLEERGARVPVKVCPTCGHTTGGGLVQEVYDKETGRRAGMFDDGPDLSEYTLKDGKKVREVVQCAPWSSGPMIFLCLEDEDGKKIFKWSEEEIDQC